MTQPQVGALARPSRQADVRITVHRLFGEPRDFTLSYPLDPDHDAMLATIYREFGGRGGREGQVIEDRMHPRLAKNAGSATSQLLDACRQRKAEIMDGGLI
jgi:hypothetical protein